MGLELEHVRDDINYPGLCTHCSCFRQGLAHQASLSDRGPALSSSTTVPQLSMDIPSFGGLTLNILNLLTLPGVRGGGVSPQVKTFWYSHKVCKRATERLGISWPTVVARPAGPSTREWNYPRRSGQLLLVFPKLLEEDTVSWKENPYPVRPLFKTHPPWILRVWMSMLWSVCHPSWQLTAICGISAIQATHPPLQSRLLWVHYDRVSLQGDRLEDESAQRHLHVVCLPDRGSMTEVPDTAVWDDITTIADICLRVKCCAIQAAGNCMAMLVEQSFTT